MHVRASRLWLIFPALLGLAGVLAAAEIAELSGPPSDEVLGAQRRMQVAPGLKVELWASEPLVRDVTSFAFDRLGRAYVVESGRRHSSVFDVGGLSRWIEDEVGLRSVEERADFLRRMLTPGNPDYADFLAALTKGTRGSFGDLNHDGVIDWHDLEVESERIRLVWDSDGDGRADRSRVFADGFNSLTSGVAAGVLVDGTNVWFACIPELWRIRAAENGKTGEREDEPIRPLSRLPVFSSSPDLESADSAAAATQRLLTGFGVHLAAGGHDLHGLIKGPDGRLYFSVGDRGASVTNREGRAVALPDCGAVFRCEPDGSQFEVFARGLRNPQDLCFDDEGNLWTADNNGDGGDKARWTLVLEGADYGWTVGWQWLPKLGAWNSERLWHTQGSNTAAYIVPPVGYVGHGPSGIAHYPGTGLGDRFAGHFFVCDFPGGVRDFRVEPDGGFFRLASEAGHTVPKNSDGTDAPGRLEARPTWLDDNSPTNLTGKILWNLSPVDLAFPPGGGLVIADAFTTWEKDGKARLWRVVDPTLANDPQNAEVRALLADGMTQRSEKELVRLLGHRDQRVRLEAQWELAGRGAGAFGALRDVAFRSKQRLPRLHALWGIGQIARADASPAMTGRLEGLLALLADPDLEVRAQAARLCGAMHLARAEALLRDLMTNSAPRVALLATLGFRELYASYHGPINVRFQKSWTEEAAGRLPRSLQARLNAGGSLGSIMWPAIEVKALLERFGVREPLLFGAATAVLADMIEVTRGSGPGIARRNLSMLVNHPDPRVRLAYLVAERRLALPTIAGFLADPDPRLVLEAARAINDVPIPEAQPELAAMLDPGAVALASTESAWTQTPLPPNFTRDEWRTWIFRRAANAAFRVGGASNAVALARFAARDDGPEVARVEALDDLADWAQPPRRDRVVGLTRPLPPRDPTPARDAFAGISAKLLDESAAGVPGAAVLATIHAAGSLGLPVLDERLAALSRHPNAEVQAEAKRLLALRKPKSIAELAATAERGSPSEQQAALAALAASTDASAAAPLAAWAGRLANGSVPPELQLDVLEAVARRAGNASTADAPALHGALVQWTNSLPNGDPLAKYRVALNGGDAAHGRKFFLERQDLACVRCHKLKGEGGELGPELAGIGRAKGREYVLRSIVQPNADIAAGFESVLVVLTDGTVHTGVLKAETTEEVTIDSPEDGRLELKKSAIAKRERSLSPMPEGLGEFMTRRDLRDLIEALAE